MLSIPMQATIGGLASANDAAGEAVFGEFDVNSGVLLVDLCKTIRPGMPETRMGENATVTNNASVDDRDLLFTDADIRQAIADYFTFAGRGLLRLQPAVNKHDPKTKIEADGIDDKGSKYRLAPDISNGQLAVIVLCWFALRQSGFAFQLEAFDDLQDVTITSVGMPRAAGDSDAEDDGGRHRRIAGYAMGGLLPLGGDGWPA